MNVLCFYKMTVLDWIYIFTKSNVVYSYLMTALDWSTVLWIHFYKIECCVQLFDDGFWTGFSQS